MSTKDTYLAVFLSNKTSPRWKAWYAMSEEERRAKDVEGLAALKAWDESHQDAIVYEGGPLGPTKRTSRDGEADIVNELPFSSSCERLRMKKRRRCSRAIRTSRSFLATPWM